MSHWFERLLNLRRGDLGRGVLLSSYYFLIISSYIIGQVARDALFLDRFEADQLPYVDISIAILVGFVIAGYIRIGRTTSLGTALMGTLILFASTAAFFWWAFMTFRWTWLFPALYIWVGIFGVLATTQVWTLANFMLTTREAKRLFGIVGAGGILGGIFGGFLSNSMAENFGTESLLFVLALFIGTSGVLVSLIWRQRHKKTGGKSEAPRMTTKDGPRSMLESFLLMRSSKHLKSIATLICITSIVTTAAGWQFKAIAKASYIETDVLAAFFGSFQGYAGILSLAAQLLLTSRLLQRFGVGIALFILPVTLAAGSVGVLIWGGLFAATFLKGSDKVLRYSIDTSALQLLYLPVPANVKNQVKSFIDTVVWRFGDGLAGLSLLIFVTYLNFTPGQISWVNLVFLGAWVLAANVARKQYVTTLGERIQEHRIDAERATAPVLDRSTTNVLASKLNSGDTEEILYGLSLFEMGYSHTAHPAMRGLVRHESAQVRQRAVAMLNAGGDKSVIEEIETLLADDDLGVRTEALLYLTNHADVDPLTRIQEVVDFPEFTIRSSIAAFLVRPGKAQNLEVASMMLDMMVDETGPDRRRFQLEAARLIETAPQHFEEQLFKLLQSGDPKVAGHAIVAAGDLGKLRFVPLLLERLGDTECQSAATKSLEKFGNRILGTLRDYLSDGEVPMELRRQIPSILVDIGTTESGSVLVESLLQGDSALRFRVISALNKFRQAHPDTKLDDQLIETVLAAEIIGHYRSYQAIGVLGEQLDTADPSLKALGESRTQEVERIFRLLGILFPKHDLHAAYLGLRSTNTRIHDNALEFLDNTLRPELRGLLVPLVDSGISTKERVLRANQLLNTTVDTSEEAVSMLLKSGDPWLRSCAAYAIGALGLKSLASKLDAWQNDPDPLLCETVRQAKRRLSEAASGSD